MSAGNVHKFNPKAAKKSPKKAESQGGGGDERRDEPEDYDQPCPVTALGFEGKWLFFATPQGDVRAIDSERMGPVALDGLFMGDVTWAIRRYRKYDSKGKPIDDAYDPEQVRRHLQRAAAEAGPIDVQAKVRGPGLYRSADALVLHLGDALWVFGSDRRVFTIEPVGLREADGKLYPVRQAEPPPAADKGRLAPATAARCGELLNFLSNWPWRSPRLAERFWLGWNFSAMVAGASRWRSHLEVTGDFGEGKTLLRQLAVGIQGGDDAVLKLTASSAPAVRNMLRASARPVFLNEVDNTVDPSRNDAIIELANVASTDGEGDIARADLRGGALRWPMRCALYFECVIPPVMKPKDQSRFTQLELGRLSTDAERAAQVRTGVESFVADAPALRARALAGIDRFAANFEVYAAALADADASTRQADQVGTILAWADVALSDVPTLEAEARVIVAQLEPAELVPPREELSDAAECWGTLVGASEVVEQISGGRRRMTVGEMLLDQLKFSNAERADTLRAIGIALRTDHSGAKWIFVANKSTGLKTVFEHTDWRGGAWPTSLRRLKGARSGDPVWMGGRQSRGVWIPAEILKTGEEEGTEPPQPHGPVGNGESTT